MSNTKSILDSALQSNAVSFQLKSQEDAFKALTRAQQEQLASIHLEMLSHLNSLSVSEFNNERELEQYESDFSELVITRISKLIPRDAFIAIYRCDPERISELHNFLINSSDLEVDNFLDGKSNPFVSK